MRRQSAETWLILALGAFALTAVVGTRLVRQGAHEPPPVPTVVPGTMIEVRPLTTDDPAAWFAYVRQFCNPVDVESRMRLEPPPQHPRSPMYQAACFALAGRIDRAREVIERLPPSVHDEAAGIVFEAGHPAADAGDDVAAGPLMELVVEFWPNHYMALYHAGASRYELGEYEPARRYLERFMTEYATEDGWRSSAREMLGRIAERT